MSDEIEDIFAVHEWRSEAPPREPTPEIMQAFARRELPASEMKEISRLSSMYSDWHDAKVIALEELVTEQLRDSSAASPKSTSSKKKWRLVLFVAAASAVAAVGLIWWQNSLAERFGDGQLSVGLSRNGKVSGLDRYPETWTTKAEDLLVNHDISRPTAFDEISEQVGEMSVGGGPDGILIRPVGTVVQSTSPHFQWNTPPESALVRFKVMVYSADGELVIASPDLETPQWTCSANLESGRSYWWIVTAADQDNETWQLPADTDPKPKFMILGTGKEAELANELELTEGSALLRFLVFVEFGLLHDAEKSLRSLEEQNPGSQTIVAVQGVKFGLR